MKFYNGLDRFQICITTMSTLQCNGAGGNFHVTLLYSGFDYDIYLVN